MIPALGLALLAGCDGGGRVHVDGVDGLGAAGSALWLYDEVGPALYEVVGATPTRVEGTLAPLRVEDRAYGCVEAQEDMDAWGELSEALIEAEGETHCEAFEALFRWGTEDREPPRSWGLNADVEFGGDGEPEDGHASLYGWTWTKDHTGCEREPYRWDEPSCGIVYDACTRYTYWDLVGEVEVDVRHQAFHLEGELEASGEDDAESTATVNLHGPACGVRMPDRLVLF